MAKIDILLPYWGDPILCKKAIESVLNQTESDWRLLVFDDYYPSNEIKDYCTSLQDERVIYKRNKENLGITKNFNRALLDAQAPFCVMMGCDDIMLPNYIATALKHIGDADFYQPAVAVIDEYDTAYLPLGDRIKRILQPRSGLYSGEKLAASLCHGNWLYFPSIMWRTNIIKKYGFDDQFKIVEDLILELTLIKDGGRLYVDSQTTFQYRRFAQSLSSKEKSKEGVRFMEETKAYRHASKIFKECGWYKASFSARAHITSRLHHLLARLG